MTVRTARQSAKRSNRRYKRFLQSISNERAAKIYKLQSEVEAKYADCLSAVLSHVGLSCDPQFADYCRSQWESDQKRNAPGCQGNRFIFLIILLSAAKFFHRCSF